MKVVKDNTDASLRVALLGHPGVGKTSLAYRLNGQDFESTSATRSLKTWSLNDISDEISSSSATLLDFGGEQLFQQINKTGFSIALIVVDGCATTIKDDVQYWSDSLNSKVEGFSGTRFLVFSRVDRGRLAIKSTDINKLVRRHIFTEVFETSAMNSSGIQKLRDAVLNVVRSQKEEHDTQSAVGSVVRILANHLCELIAKNPRVLDAIEWRDMERVIAAALEEIGFAVELTPSAKDGGKDVILTCKIANEAHVFYVEVKHWRRGQRPGWHEIAEFIEVNAQDKTQGGLFLSSSGYTGGTYSRLAQLSRQQIRLGSEEKIVFALQDLREE